MFMKVTQEEFSDSQFAIGDYRKTIGNKDYPIESNVIILDVLKNTVLCDEKLEVSAVIDTNNSYVVIHDIDNRYFGRYDNRYQKFSYDNGKLYIDCTDREDNVIKIVISN